VAEGGHLSILSQLLLVLDDLDSLLALVFQFFPSCYPLRDAGKALERLAVNFQFFPSCYP
jgi:hypothetical protein